MSCWLASPIPSGRIELELAEDESDVGITVNEYETLLMRHDLAEVLEDPFKFVAGQGRRMLADPRAIPAKSHGLRPLRCGPVAETSHELSRPAGFTGRTSSDPGDGDPCSQTAALQARSQPVGVRRGTAGAATHRFWAVPESDSDSVASTQVGRRDACS